MAFESLSEKLSGVFKKLRSRGKLTEADIKEAMREVRLALLAADVNIKAVKAFVSAVTEKATGEAVLESLTPAQQVVKIVNDELVDLLGGEEQRIKIASKPPTVILMCGLQGSGKTTNIAKLAGHFKKQGKRPILVACDIYRPAAVRQLEVVGEGVGVPVFTMPEGTDAVTIAKGGVSHAEKHGNDMVFIDTAGRLHIDAELMDELKAIKVAVNPTEILLVMDAMTGQDAANVAASFDEALGIDGMILTKTDGDTRGGAALSVKYVTGKPIKFIGTGEKLQDIEPFHPDRMASRILGMGDMLSLIERAEQAYDEKQAEELERKLRDEGLDLTDYLDQLRQIRQMGSMDQLVGMIPGINPAAAKDVDFDDKLLDRMEAMILSMTPDERAKPDIINGSRRRRIAAGSGTEVSELNRMLKQFDQMRKLLKQFSGVGGKRKKKLPFFG